MAAAGYLSWLHSGVKYRLCVTYVLEVQTKGCVENPTCFQTSSENRNCSLQAISSPIVPGSTFTRCLCNGLAILQLPALEGIWVSGDRLWVFPLFQRFLRREDTQPAADAGPDVAQLRCGSVPKLPQIRTKLGSYEAFSAPVLFDMNVMKETSFKR